MFITHKNKEEIDWKFDWRCGIAECIDHLICEIKKKNDSVIHTHINSKEQTTLTWTSLCQDPFHQFVTFLHWIKRKRKRNGLLYMCFTNNDDCIPLWKVMTIQPSKTIFERVWNVVMGKNGSDGIVCMAWCVCSCVMKYDSFKSMVVMIMCLSDVDGKNDRECWLRWC